MGDSLSRAERGISGASAPPPPRPLLVANGFAVLPEILRLFAAQDKCGRWARPPRRCGRVCISFEGVSLSRAERGISGASAPPPPRPLLVANGFAVLPEILRRFAAQDKFGRWARAPRR